MGVISVRRSRKEEALYMKTEAFDEKFDEGSSVMDALDISKSQRSMQKQKHVNVDFPS